MSAPYPLIPPLKLGSFTASDGIDGDIMFEIEIDACGPEANVYLKRHEAISLIAWMQTFMAASSAKEPL